MSQTCAECHNEIDEDRLNWARDKGYSVKYCKACSNRKKAARGENPITGYQKPPEKDVDWDSIADSKIVHNFMRDALQKGATCEEAGNQAYEAYFAQLKVLEKIQEKKKEINSFGF